MLEPTTARPLHPLARAAAVAAVVAALVALLLGVMRPWYVRWGASDAEVAGALPGDELWPGFLRQETRALSVAAPPGEVWPWIAQLGQDKGGFYSYELLENLVGARMRNADRLLGLPAPRPGERVWMAPPDAFGGTGWAVLERVEPERVLALLVHEGADPAPTGSWVFVLQPEGAGTRLLLRGRAGRPGLEGWGSRAVRLVLFEPIHFVMERRMMLGIAERAEGRPPAKLALVVEPVAWLAMLGVALVSAGASLWRGRPGRALRLLAGAGAGLVVLPLTEPPLVVTVAAAALLVWAVPWALGRRAGQRRLPV
jgi:hypothetical protein